MKRRPTDRGWSAKLTRSIVLKDGTTLATLADARSFILREPAYIQERLPSEQFCTDCCCQWAQAPTSGNETFLANKQGEHYP
jgi:hypothetical protein